MTRKHLLLPLLLFCACAFAQSSGWQTGKLVQIDKTVRTEGVVSAVCKSMGCWMEIADPAGQAHIKMAGHSFFVPRDASGHRAVVQGTVLRPSHDECSEEAKQQTGAVAKIEIEATGVEFLD